MHRFRKISQGLKVILAVPLATMLASCGQVNLETKDPNLTKPTVTQMDLQNPVPIYPADTPSSADGKIVWQKENCAACHGDGTGGSANINFTDKLYMAQQKPVDQYMFIAYGQNTNHPKDGAKAVPTHPQMFNQITNRQIWNLVFFCRSLARPVIESGNPEYLALDAVFGSNCVVCHGKKGNGDGPLAHNLEPVPANFASFPRFYDRTDAILWDHIANGIKWEGMPNFLGKQDKAKNVKFDKDYIWKLVQYVRHFQSTEQSFTVAQSNNSQSGDAQKSTTATPTAK
jgi:mono/diheme cytochrome c family protein